MDSASRRKRALWMLVGLACAAIAAVLVAMAAAHHRQRYAIYEAVARTLPAELAAARAEGLPLTPDDLRRDPPVPGSANAAPIYRQITGIYLRMSKEAKQREADVCRAMMRVSRTGADRASATKLLAGRSQVLQLAGSAVRLPSCDFERAYQKGSGLLFPEHVGAHYIARLCAIKALLDSDEGRLSDALLAITTGARVGRHMSEAPDLAAAGLRISMDAYLHDTLTQVVVGHQTDPAVMRLATSANKAMEPREGWVHSLRGEVVLGRVYVDQIRRETDLPAVVRSLTSRKVPTDDRVLPALCDATEVRMVAHWRQCFGALNEPRDDLAAQYSATKTLMAALQAKEAQPTYELIGVLMDSAFNIVGKLAADEARRRLRVGLIEVVAYRQSHGSYPAALSDLPVAPPPDIFTGRPLLYRGTPAGFILYSVGENLKDDGGKAKGAKDGERPDIVIQYPLVD